MSRDNTPRANTFQKMERRTTGNEKDAFGVFAEQMRLTPIPADELPNQLPLYLNRIALANVLFLDDIYRRIVDVPGQIFEFGVRWGRTTSLLSALRAIHEPYNHTRRIVGFDTFTGFPSVTEKDGNADAIRAGNLSVADDYAATLELLLSAQEALSPIPQIRKHDLVVGDVVETLPEYLAEHRETVVALAYMDLDIYEPTRFALQTIVPYLTKGSIVVLDQLSSTHWPGETEALREIFPTTSIRLRRSPIYTQPSWFVVE